MGGYLKDIGQTSGGYLKDICQIFFGKKLNYYH